MKKKKGWLQHRQDVKKIAERFDRLRQNRQRKPSRIGSSNMTRELNYFHWDKELGIRELNQIIELDPIKKIAYVESGISMEELAFNLFQEGWRVPIVPEFKGITVGGAINGAAIESSSHQEGQFNDACLSYEVLTGSGKILEVSKESNPDLFYGLSGAYGTLGLVLSAAIKIVPAKPWVELQYHAFENIHQALGALKALAETADFLEGLVFEEKKIVLVEGNLRESQNGNLLTIHLDRPWSPWFYQLVKTRSSSSKKEQIPLLQYLFRHDRGAFWMGAYALHWTLLLRYYLENRLGLKKYSQNLLKKGFFEKYFRLKEPGSLFRTLIGSSMGSRNLYKMLHAKSEQWFAEKFIVQDYYLPIDRSEDFIKFCIEETKIFPLWLCPVKSTPEPQLLSPHYIPTNRLLLDIGIYGMPWKDLEKNRMNQKLEEFMRKLGGKKMLYSYNFYSAEQFWQIYPQALYGELREKYQAEIFPSIEAKMGFIAPEI